MAGIFFRFEKCRFFCPVIENTIELIVSTINIYEIYRKLLTEKDENIANQIIGVIIQAKVIDISTSIAIQAAQLSFTKKLPMADCLIYVTARQNDAILWTQNADFKNLDGVKYIKK